MTNDTKEPTRDEIRRAARALFAAQGYAGTSIRDIAKEVGIQGASMYNHFTSKEEILWDLTLGALTLLAKDWKRTESSLAEASSEARLTGFVRNHVRYHAVHRHDARIVNAELRRLSADHLHRAVDMRADYERALRGLVGAYIDDVGGHVRDLPITVYAILEMGIAVAEWYRPRGRLTPDQLGDLYGDMALKLVAPLEPAKSAGSKRTTRTGVKDGVM